MSERQFRINGVEESSTAATLKDLLEAKGIAPDARGVAVAVNGAVVPRAAWAEKALKANDTVDIVHARQGG